MRLVETILSGVWILELDRIVDDRGFFARTWCKSELAAQGLSSDLAQCSISYNARAGTLRGMHYQAAPHEEEKVVSCIRGSIYDVVVDLRPESTTFRRWIAVDLDDINRRSLYIPRGCAHGFQTLVDDSVVQYGISVAYQPAYARGVRWNDPAFGIEWPAAERIMSERDRSHPDFVA